MKSRVSVIVPVYNGEKFLAKAIESVLSQEHPAHEIIAIDDGSKDSSPDILERYADRIHIKRIPNAGVSNARNLGMRMATGDLLAFLDHDDVWFKNYLKKQVEALERYPGAVLSSCNYVYRPGTPNRRLVRHHSMVRLLDGFQGPYMPDPFPQLFKECFIGTTSCVVMRRELLDQAGGFDHRYRICQDYDYWLRAAMFGGFVVLSDVLLFKRVHGNNLSGDLIEMMNEHLQVQKSVFSSRVEWIRKSGHEAACRIGMAKANYFTAGLEFNRGYLKDFLRHMKSGLEVDGSAASWTECSRVATRKLLRTLTLGLLSRDG